MSPQTEDGLLLAQARQLLRVRRYEDVLRVLATASPTSSYGAQVQHVRAEALNELGRYEEARVAIEASLALDPQDLGTLLMAVWIYRNLNRRPEMMRVARRAVEVDPNSGPAWAAYAVALADNGKAVLPKTERAVNKAITLAPNNSGVYINVSIAAMAANRYDDAERFLRKALELDPTSAVAQNNLGMLTFGRSRYRGLGTAAEKFQNSITLAPHTRIGRHNLVGVTLRLVSNLAQFQLVAAFIAAFIAGADLGNSLYVATAILWLVPVAYLGYTLLSLPRQVRPFVLRSAFRLPVLPMTAFQVLAWAFFWIPIVTGMEGLMMLLAAGLAAERVIAYYYFRNRNRRSNRP